MNRVMKFALVCLTVIGLAGVVCAAYAQENATQKVISVSGEVVSLDMVKSEVMIKQLKDAVTSTYVNTAFTVEPEVKVQKGVTSLKLSDLKAGDKVTLNYAADVSGKPTVISIIVEAPVAAPVE
jgi:Cu/Ag efflux protein CusF